MTVSDEMQETGGESAFRLAQTARSEATKEALLEAAIECLNDLGFARTSTLQIQERSGISRGGLLHHFGSKDAMLIGAVHHLAENRLTNVQPSCKELPPRERVRYAIESLWKTFDGPLFWAAIELWVGARTNPELAAALRPAEKETWRVIQKMSDDLFGEELCSRPQYEQLREVIIPSMRGVALAYTIAPRPMAQDPHIDAWCSIAYSILGV
ncbi:TetR/AcrR family transcriptional regulator [Rhodococcus sp. 5G237]